MKNLYNQFIFLLLIKIIMDNDIEVILLTGAKSKAFIAGADIKEFLKR